MRTEYGLPVVNAHDVNDFLADRFMSRWPRIREPQKLQEYLASEDGSRDERLRKFIPRDEVVSFRDSRGQVFKGIRRETSDGVVVFSELPGKLIPVCAEFKHGIEEISINLPGGGNHHREENFRVAIEEFQQETGIVLENVVNLTPLGISNDARIHKNRTFYFLGFPIFPVVVKEKKLDEDEILEPFLMPLPEWVNLIDMNKVIDGQSVICTYLALSRLGYLRV